MGGTTREPAAREGLDGTARDAAARCESLEPMSMETLEFGQLYERHARDVLRFALHLTGSRAVAEDITSETFVRAWVGSDAIEVGTVKAYLFMIARNLHVDWRRHEAKRADLAHEPANPMPGPDLELDAKRELRGVLAALQRLPELDRAALLMRSHDTMPYDHIAAALGLTAAAARVKVHRARMKLGELRAEKEETP
jgi:RNA polymerase sigma-70 factor (ECF subfamily)